MIQPPPWDTTPLPEGYPLYTGELRLTLHWHMRLRLRHDLFTGLSIERPMHRQGELLEATMTRRLWRICRTLQNEYLLLERPL